MAWGRGLPAGFLFCVGLAILSACTTPPPTDHQPELTFAHLSPMEAAKHWAEERLRASVGPAIARFIIRDAKVVEEKLPTTGGFLGYFTVDQEARYEATLDVLLEIVDGEGKRLAFAEAKAHHTQTVPEDLSINERESYWFGLTENLLKSFDQEMETAIRGHLAGFLR